MMDWTDSDEKCARISGFLHFPQSHVGLASYRCPFGKKLPVFGSSFPFWFLDPFSWCRGYWPLSIPAKPQWSVLILGSGTFTFGAIRTI